MQNKIETLGARELEHRLAPRRASEKLHGQGHRAGGHGDFLLRYEHVIGPLFQLALQAAGLYSRGKANALRPVVRNLRLEYPNLPASLNGFRILHLSDLHIDGMSRMAEIVAGLVSGIEADLCVMT